MVLIGKFYQEHFFKLLSAVIFVSIATSIISLLFLDFKIVTFGLILGLFTAVYLTLVFIFGQQKRAWLQKEFYVSIIYTAGIWGPGLIMTNVNIASQIPVLVVIFFLLVFSGILTFSIYDYEHDKKNKFITLISLVGIKKVNSLIYISLITSTILLILLIFKSEGKLLFAAVILMMMTIQLLFILRLKKNLKDNDKYRYLGEAIFFFPILIILF